MALESQIGGSHYADQKIQPVEYIHANNIGFLPGNVVKYITRYRLKHGAEDIRKAIHYCQLILELEYGECPGPRTKSTTVSATAKKVGTSSKSTTKSAKTRCGVTKRGSGKSSA